VVVGGGNSAGQAAVYLATIARKVVIVVRGADLRKSMSAYLVQRIEETPNIEVLTNTVVRRMGGAGHLASVEIEDCVTGEVRTLETAALFSFIGAVPHTDWLPAEIAKDSSGFVRTGPELTPTASRNGRRAPFLLETNRKGVCAAGDVRAGSIKRVASAVGEGAMAIQFVHEALKEM
jgi:thioredoxin reductase (NADPH)